MLLALDIGNSSVSVGVFDLSDPKQPDLLTHFKISNKAYSADEYALLIRDFLTRSYAILHPHAEPLCIHGSIISSVVPGLTTLLAHTAEILTSRPPLLIDQGIRTGFGIHIKNPEQLGSDLVSNVAASLHCMKPLFIVLDVGTATTMTIVDENSDVIGTIIVPGLKVSMNALCNSAALLNVVPLEYSEELIGRDTQSAIRSGVINGNVYMLDGFIRNIREKLFPTIAEKDAPKPKLGLIATGGLAKQVLPYMRNHFLYDETLTLEGEAYLYLKNRKNFV